MRLTLEPTDEIILIEGTPTRVWRGTDEAGTEVKAYVLAIQPQTHDPQRLAVFEELFLELPPHLAAGDPALIRAEAEIARLRRLPDILRCDCCDACGESPDYEAPCANVIAERARLYIEGLPCTLADARAALAALTDEAE